MSVLRHRGGWAILLTFVVAFLLTLVPMPEWVDRMRPQWVAMVLIYWCMALPDRVNVGTGWLLGLFMDVAQGTLLGQHALAMSITGFITVAMHTRLRVLPLWQQSGTVFLLLLINALIVYWIDGFTGHPPTDWRYLVPPVASTLLWPWAFVMLRDLRRRMRVA